MTPADAGTIETSAVTNGDSTASTRDLGATGEVTGSGNIATDAIPDATAGGRDDPSTSATGAEGPVSDSVGSSEGPGTVLDTAGSSQGAGSGSVTGQAGACASGDMACASDSGASTTAPGQGPDSDTDLTPPSLVPGPDVGCNSILEIATATPDLSTLVQGIQV